MRNTFTSLSLAALLAFPLCGNAQQLPNNNFGNWKETCGSTEALTKTRTGGSIFKPVYGLGTELRVRPGVEPESWNGSSVNQKVGLEVKKELVSKLEENGQNILQLTNDFVGLGTMGSNAPGYINFGTPWVFADTDVDNCDGGSYGGMDFTYRPDAIQGTFKRTDTNEEKSHLIFYSWKGTFKSNIGSVDGAYVEEATDVDRAILGKVEASEKGTLIAKADYEFSGNDWQTIIVPIEYVSNELPEKVNVIASCGSYWDRSIIVKGTTLQIKDISLIYYSRLKDLQVNGVSIEGFASDKYEYAVDAAMPEESAFSFATLGTSGVANAEIALDKENAKATITVRNAHGADNDGISQHEYVVKFNKEDDSNPSEASVYEGKLVIEMGGSTVTDEPLDAKVSIEYTSADECIFTLPNFMLMGQNMGNIVVPNVKVTKDGNNTCFAGTVQNLKLDAGGGASIYADATLEASNCTIDENGEANMVINVIWHQDESTDIPITVYFNGQGPKPSAIEGVDVDNSNAPVEFYNLQGIRVNSSDMAPGIYIRRQGTDVKKVLVK